MSKFTATVTKETKESKVGLAFLRDSKDSPLLISIVRRGGLFENTDIAAGMLPLQINGTDVTGMMSKEAADLLREADAGELTIIAAGAVATVTKDSAETLCGISLQRQEGKGIVVTKLREGGLFEGSVLAPGLIVSAINGIKTPATTKEAIAMLKAAEGEVSIAAYDPAWATMDDAADEEQAAEPVAEDPPQEQAPEAAPSKTEEEEEEPKEEEEEPVVQERGVEKKEDESSILDSLCTMCA